MLGSSIDPGQPVSATSARQAYSKRILQTQGERWIQIEGAARDVEVAGHGVKVEEVVHVARLREQGKASGERVTDARAHIEGTGAAVGEPVAQRPERDQRPCPDLEVQLPARAQPVE